MRILMLTEMWPHPRHTIRAANILLFELAASLAARPDVELSLLRVARGNETEPNEAEREGMTQLAAAGVEIRSEIRLPPTRAARSPLLRAIVPGEVDFFPETAHRAAVTKAVEAARPDVVLIQFNEWLTAVCCELPMRKFAYYGNPPPKNRVAARRLARRHGASRWRILRQSIYDRGLEAIHLRHMMGFEFLGDVSANDAEYYQRAGHPNAFYLRNLWVDRGESWREKRAAPSPGPARIIANVGRLSATANSHGLEILGAEVLPELRRILPKGSFEIHLLGGGAPYPKLRALLNQSEIQLRGFVDEIDDEIARAPIFLCVNNGSAYNVGHTRYLHAWSLGAAVVAHSDVRLSMPELVDGENCLLGSSPREIAEKIASALGDQALRWRIGDTGYETFRTLFTAPHVAATIHERLARAA